MLSTRTACGRAVAFVVPDMAMAAAMAAVVYLFLLFGGATALFHDSDAGWHIRNGERILQSHVLPRVDAFSFSKAGEPWMAWEWGADVVTGAVHQAAGLGGVALLYGMAIGAAVWMWFGLNWAAGGNFLLACLFAAPMLSTASLHWLARPHILGWLFLIGTVWVAEKPLTHVRGSVKHLAGIAVGSAVWANVHASFLLAPVVFGIYGAGVVLRRMIWTGGDARNEGPYFVAAGVSLVATLANPAGWRLHQHVIAYLTDTALLDRIGEFQSFNFHSEGSMQIVLGLAIAFAGAFAALVVKRPERFLLSILLSLGALRSARALPLAALLALPLANGSITEMLSLSRGLARPLRRWLDDALSYGERLRGVDRQFHGAALIPLVVCGVLAWAGPRAAFPAAEFPVNAAAKIAELPADARIFAPDKFGGYLIYRFNGQRKVFFDGRSDFYGADFLARYGRMMAARPGWREEFGHWNFSHALVPPEAAIAGALEDAGWMELYRDRTAVLLEKPNGGGL